MTLLNLAQSCKIMISVNLSKSCSILLNLANKLCSVLLYLAKHGSCKYLQDPLALSCIWWVLQVLERSCKMLLHDLAITIVLKDLVSTCILLRLDLQDDLQELFLGPEPFWNSPALEFKLKNVLIIIHWIKLNNLFTIFYSVVSQGQFKKNFKNFTLGNTK
jgi:hypothetical protein